MNQHISQEQMRQSQHYSAVRARLFNAKPKPRPAPIVEEKPTAQILFLRDCDAHVIAWRKWSEMKTILNSASTSASFPATVDWEQHAALVDMQDNADEIMTRRPMKDICLEVLQDFPGVTFEEVRGVHRARNIVAARQACMHAIYTERKDISFPRLANFFGMKEHTGAMYAVRKGAAAKGDAEAAAWCAKRQGRMNDNHRRKAKARKATI